MDVLMTLQLQFDFDSFKPDREKVNDSIFDST